MSNSNFVQTVPNKADISPRPTVEKHDHSIDKTCQDFWRINGTGDSLAWYREGKTISHANSSKTGSDLLIQIVRLAIPHIIKKYMRENEKQVSSKVTDLIHILDVINETLIDDSINTISANDNRLSQEDVMAFLQGYITDKYEKNRELYED